MSSEESDGGNEDTFQDDGSKNPLNDDDDDYEPGDNKKKSKKGKKRKAKGEEKSKGKKKKKRKKNESEEEVEEPAADSDEYNSNKRGRKKKDRADREEKSSKSSSRRSKELLEEEPAPSDTPSVEEVCEQLDLQDVEIEFTETHYQNPVTYKMFTQFVKPILQKENPKAASSKIMMLTAAKWREFCEENPNSKDEDQETSGENAAEKSEEEEDDSLHPFCRARMKNKRKKIIGSSLGERKDAYSNLIKSSNKKS